VELSKVQKVGLWIGAVLTTLWIARPRAKAMANIPQYPLGSVQALIRAEAERQGVDPRLALTVAKIESGFRSNLTGDREWYSKVGKDGRTNWERYVRDVPAFNNNPYRNQKELWISYGLFQTLAPFHLWREDRNADPRVLFDAEVNARIGVAILRAIQDRLGDDPLKIRMSYVCGNVGCSEAKSLLIAKTLARVGSEFGLYIGTDAEIAERATAMANKAFV
jgi:hypothetical protein